VIDEEIIHDAGYDPYNSATTRKTPPLPAWLRNDPEIEALALAICARLPRWEHTLDVRENTRGPGWSPEITLSIYRKG
jgi:hypothetical protein